MSDNKDLTKVIQLIDGVRSAGAEPIVQVPHDYTTQQTIDYLNYLNGTMNRGIKLWCIGNEPDNNNVGRCRLRRHLHAAHWFRTQVGGPYRHRDGAGNRQL